MSGETDRTNHLTALKHRARALRVELHALYLAYRDPRMPWYARVFTACVVAYALSPIDLIPDFIPVLGYLDDLILLPLGIYIALKMIPAPVLTECRARALELSNLRQPTSRTAAVVIVFVWLAVAVIALALWRRLQR